MNSNKKYDFYKNTIYYLIASAVLLFASIIVVCVVGFNHQTSVSAGSLVLKSALISIISLILVFLYVGFRYDFAKAFGIVAITTHNLLLSTAIIAIIRVPVTESLLMGYMLLIGISTLYTLMLTEKLKNVNLKKADYNEIIKNATKQSLKPIVLLTAIILVVLMLTLLVASAYIFSLARVLFVMLLIVIYSAFTLMLPVWCFFSSKIKNVKRAKVDTNVENQKVVKAVSVDGEEVASAEIKEANE